MNTGRPETFVPREGFDMCLVEASGRVLRVIPTPQGLYHIAIWLPDSKGLADAALLPFVRYVGAFHPGFKIAASIGGPDFDFDRPGWLGVRISVFDDPGGLLTYMDGREHEILAHSPSKVTCLVKVRDVPGYAALDNVKVIENIPQLEWHNDESAKILRVDPGAWDKLGLDGTGQIVALGDTGLDTGDVHTMTEDLRGRVVAIYDWTGPTAPQ